MAAVTLLCSVMVQQSLDSSTISGFIRQKTFSNTLKSLHQNNDIKHIFQ